MPVSTEDDWSDSDEEIGAGMETNILLGVPEGRVETDADIKDAAVSRIGGLPVRALSLSIVRTTCRCGFNWYPVFQGVLTFAGTPIFLFPMQGLLRSYGAPPAGVVSI